MEVYNYNPHTLEYTGHCPADVSPLEFGVYLIPAYATTEPVPNITKDNCGYFFKNGKWILEDTTPSVYIPTDEEFTNYVRSVRNQLLTEVDKVFIRHQSQIILGITPTLSEDVYTSWLKYAQELRDFMNSFDIAKYPDKDVSKVIFPTKPIAY